MAKERVHRNTPGRPREVRTNSVEKVSIENINALANDYVDMKKLTENLIQNGAMTPLEFLVSVYMSDDCDMKLRVDAAKSATKFVHKAKPVSVEHTGAEGKDLKIIQLQDIAREKMLEYLEVIDVECEEANEEAEANG